MAHRDAETRREEAGGGFLYFVAGRQAAPAELLEEVGIAALPQSTAWAPFGDGPGGEGGVIVAAAGTRLRYAPDEQTWRPVARGLGGESESDGEADAPAYWIGFETGRPPGPEQLARDEMIPGHAVTLADGRSWHVPIIRDAAGACGLPMRYGLDPQSGRPAATLGDEHLRLWDAALGVLAALADAEENDDGQIVLGLGMSEADAMRLAADVIGLNYHASLAELLAVGALDGPGIFNVCRAMSDFDGLVALLDAEAKKKSTPDGQTMSSGEEGSDRTTGRRRPTSTTR